MLDIINTTLRQNLTSSSPLSTTKNNPGDQVNDQADQVSDQVKQLLAIMDDQFWSTNALMESFSLTRKPTFRKNYLYPAIQAGLVVMKYPDNPRHPQQKYKKVDG
ncbi:MULTISPECIES: Fic family protein [unclassified Picosynechococcus]|uniref:Fic family protein n=1 Tax=unclassified Picosynechococcus TaxID=3079910 RepID=UPI0004AA66C5|nr:MULTISPECIES: hypothetical protein [unclassified Picosynechococcus]AMA10738.1 hypothetical protein AWQ23_14930 [Picosynechococcus sp. PCC 73109]